MAGERFSQKKRFNKTNVKGVSEDKPFVYKILDGKGDNIYAGITKRGQGVDRLKDHLSGGQDAIPGARDFQVKPMNSIKDAKSEEKRIIGRDKPKHNKRGK